MEKNINELTYKISKLTTDELDNLSIVLRDKYGFNSNIYKYPLGIISGNDKSYDILLKSAGSYKLKVLKTIKEMKLLGLKEAKDIIDSVPYILFENVSMENAERYKYELETIGAVVEIL
jgi:large subunit ribosomal protein L7/L12